MAEPIYIRSWDSFQMAMVETLAAIAPWRFLVLRERADPQRSVQFAMEDSKLHAEAMGNDLLPAGMKISAEGEDALRRAGWHPPREGSWWADLHWPTTTDEYGRMAAMAVVALRDVFQLPSPTALETEEGRQRPPAPEGAIVRPDAPTSDVGPRHLEQTVEYMLASEPHAPDKAVSLFARSLQANDVALRQVEAGDRRALAAAADYARTEGAVEIPAEGCLTEAGMRHVVAVARDKKGQARRLLVLEAISSDGHPGSRLVGRPGTWIDRGSPPYLHWMLEHDPHIRQLFDSEPPLREGVMGGSVVIDYRLVRVAENGKVTALLVALHGFDPGTLHLGTEEQA